MADVQALPAAAAAAAADGTDAAAGAPFVNQGLRRWEAERQRWVQKGGGGGSAQQQRGRAPPPPRKAQTVDTDAIIDTIFVGKGNGVLPRPVMLPQMIDLLVDLWETEGLYD